jgi:hypothetical protein
MFVVLKVMFCVGPTSVQAKVFICKHNLSNINTLRAFENTSDGVCQPSWSKKQCIHTVKRFNVFDTNAETEKSPQMPNMFEENWLRSKTLNPKNIHKGK